MDIRLLIKDIDDANREDKLLKAVASLSKALKIPATIEKKSISKEEYPYKAQEQLYNDVILEIGLILDDLYSRLCSTLGLPLKHTVKKSIDPSAPKLGKEIIWNPKTGEPITDKSLDKLLDSIDKFLNRDIQDKKDEIVISQAAVSRIISNLRKNGASMEELRKIPLDDIRYNGKPWSDINTFKKLNDAFPDNYDDLHFRDRILGNYITQVNDSTRAGIRNILDNGFAAGKTKGEISQELFNKFGSLNKDWDRIVDTEGVNLFNQQYINEQIRGVPEDEPIYFIRREYFDNKTCQFCNRAQNPVIALWVDKPMQDENIDDPVASIALWAGKSNFGKRADDWQWAEGANHPNCFPNDTEVLTGDGWKLFKDVSRSDVIMAINPESKEVDFIAHKGLISYHYEGNMVRFSGRNFDLMATPDHSQIYLSMKRRVLKSKTMMELYEMGKVVFPRAVGVWQKPAKKIQVSDQIEIDDITYARFWAWYLSDGSGRKRDDSFQIPQKDDSDIKADLGEIITSSGHIRSPYNKLLMEMKGRMCHEKYIPDSVKALRKEALIAFLDSYSKADGMNRSGLENHSSSYQTRGNKRGFDISFFTTSDRLASDLGEVIVKAGYIPSYALNPPTGELLKFPNGEYRSKLNLHIVRMCKSKYRHFYRANKNPGIRELIPYSGDVYDVELVKWHFLLVRRNGKVAWSGNCRGAWDRFYPEYGDITL